MVVRNSDLSPEVQKHWTFFNQHPELGFAEHQTAAYITKHLQRWKIEHKTGLAGSGILATIKGQRPELGCLLLRCEMDAIRTTAGKNSDPVAAHLCGHDGHMAIMLSLSHLLHAQKKQLRGTVKILFQPGEETLSGAQAVMSAGAPYLSRVDMVFALHFISVRADLKM